MACSTACTLQSRNLRVLGAIFNRLPLEGFYSLEACKEVGSQEQQETLSTPCHYKSCVFIMLHL